MRTVRVCGAGASPSRGANAIESLTASVRPFRRSLRAERDGRTVAVTDPGADAIAAADPYASVAGACGLRGTVVVATAESVPGAPTGAVTAIAPFETAARSRWTMKLGTVELGGGAAAAGAGGAVSVPGTWPPGPLPPVVEPPVASPPVLPVLPVLPPLPEPLPASVGTT